MEKDYLLAREPYLSILSDEWLAITEDNRLLPDHFVCTKNCQTSIYMGHYRQDCRMEIRLPDATRIIENPVYILGGANNYAHWVMDVLPRLKAWKINPQINKLPILTDKTQAKFYNEWLEILGINESNIIHLDYPCLALCKQALYPSTRTDTRYGGPIRNQEQLKWLHDLLYNPNVKQEALLYITRGLNSPDKRRIANEDELIKLVMRYGFTVTETEGMSVREQIALFQSARVILSVHGAALANSIFSPPGTHIIELVNKEFNKCYPETDWFIQSASLLKQEYTRIIGTACEANARDARPVNIIGKFNLDEIEAAIKRAIAKPSNS